MARPSRMTDVAEMAGVSTMTVSRVLNGHPSVSDEARRKVLAAIERLRYQPNELARSLRERRSRQIGILVPYISDPFFATCAHAISAVAKQHSYSVVLATSNEDPAAELDEASRMVRRNIEGLVVIPARIGKARSLLLGHQFNRLPIIALDRPIEGGHFDRLLVENEHGARIGTDHLISLGHKRIAFLGLSPELYTMRMRELGYRSAMQSSGLSPRVLELSTSQESTRLTLLKFLSGKLRPTALLCANNLLTRHVLHAMQTMNLHPPDPVALVGFDDFDTADLMRPGITTVRQPDEVLGRTAAQMLFERLAAGARAIKLPPREVMMAVELIVRGSCGTKTSMV
jgi:LacI family transcriptional regulator